MDPEPSELKQRKPADNKPDESESEIKNVQKKDDTTDVPAVIKTKEEYFDALRQWLQQVQLQQMAYTYFPYYLSSNLQANPNNMFMPSSGTSSTPQMPFFPPPFSAFPQMPMFTPQTNSINAGPDGIRTIPPPPQAPPVFANNLFQPNRIDNIRQNMQILYQNGGYEYVIAPIWKRFIAESIDVFILFVIKLMIIFMMIDLFNIQM